MLLIAYVLKREVKVRSKLLSPCYTFVCREHTVPQKDDIGGAMKSELSMHITKSRSSPSSVEILNQR